MQAANQQIKIMQANAAWQKYEARLNNEYEKQKRLTAQQSC